PGVVTIPLSIVIPLVLFVLIVKRRKDASVERLMRRSGSLTPAVPGSSGVPPRPTTPAQRASPARWAAPERSSRPSDAAGGRGHRIPQRRQPAPVVAGKKDTAAPGSPAARSPTATPPPQRRTRAGRPMPPK
ncbi:MAG: hypothetical protein ACP5UQ_09760, partial [Anaerolineae bacterium]